MIGPQPARDYPPVPSLSRRLLTGLADFGWTLAIVALAYLFAEGLAELMF